MIKQVVTLYGAQSKVGVTMICQALTEYLANTNPDKNVILLHCDGKEGTNYSSIKHESCIDDIKVQLESDVLTADELISACVNKNNLYTLQGTKQLKERKGYHPASIEKLFHICREEFDIVVVDAGSSIDMGMAIGSLIHSDVNLLVTTQQAGSITSYLSKKHQILNELAIDFGMLIINKFAFSSGRFLPEEKTLSEKYEIREVQTVSMSQYGWQAEHDKESLLGYKEKQYINEVEILGNNILSVLGYPNLSSKKKKEWGFRKFRERRNNKHD